MKLCPVLMAVKAMALAAACLAGGCVTVQFDSEPQGAEVYLNGRLVGTTPMRRTFLVLEGIGGSGAMVLPGHRLDEAQTLAPGGAGPVLALTSVPSGAVVYKNGRRIGTAPMYDTSDMPASYRAVWPDGVLAASGHHRAESGSPPAPEPLKPAPASVGPVRGKCAVVIGISDYAYRGQWGLANLRYAADDAKAMAAYLSNSSGGRFDHVTLLTDKDATTKNIRAAVREGLRSVQKDDLVLIYWSGHGSPDPQDVTSLYLLTYDTDPQHMASTGYAMDDFKADVARLQARRVLILADTCHSAGISDPKIGMRGARDNKIVEGVKGVGIVADGGDDQAVRMIFTSCEGGELSRESAELGGGHGVFTHVLLQGLKGGADVPKNGGDGDGKVTLGELIEYTRDQVKRFTENQQHPDTAGRFDRGLLMGETK